MFEITSNDRSEVIFFWQIFSGAFHSDEIGQKITFPQGQEIWVNPYTDWKKWTGSLYIFAYET